MKKHHSFRMKITLCFVVAMASAVVCCWLATKFFLKDYYTRSKIEVLEQCYELVDQHFGDFTELDEDDELSLDKLSLNTRVSLLVYCKPEDSDSPLVYTNVYNENEGLRILACMQKYLDLRSDEDLKDFTVLQEDNGDYTIYKINDKVMESDNIDLFGTLENGSYVFIRTNYQSIEEAAGISSTFLMYVGIAVIIIGAILVYLMSRAITRPIEKMSNVAKQMSDLNFDVRADVKRKDEIGVLGESLDSLSRKLEKTIGELKEANNELQKDIERKVEIDNLRTEFLSNVSHELKTPIALIQGYAEGLNENISEDAESRQFYCDVIIDEAGKMNKMVKKLLTLNQIEFGNNQMDYERFDIVSMLQSVLNATEILRQQKGVTLHFHEKDPVYVWADEYMIEEVVTNYVSNAMNHVSKSNEIAVSLQKTGASVRISVYNTGEPIPEEDLDKIWIKFYKVDKARTREYGGSGIGLSIVKAIMESHNQKFGVINHQGGVEFWFELDAAKEETQGE